MFWQQDNQAEEKYRVAEDVFDLLFRIRGNNLDIDHAHVLAQALQQHLSNATCDKIGVHGVRLAQSGNGWTRPSASLPLSRRARLAIRLHRDEYDEVADLSHKTLFLGDQKITLGESSVRKLSGSKALFAHAISCDKNQSEVEFLGEIATRLRQMDIEVSKMICGTSREIRAGAENIFSRSLLVADLKAHESVALQRQGIGAHQLMGCGLFVPHRGIDAVYGIQD